MNSEAEWQFIDTNILVYAHDISAGQKHERAMMDAPWGDYWGSFKDKFGVQWMINVEGAAVQ